MILLYGAGGGPGRGEIPMDPIRYRASDAFLFCTWGFEEKLSAATKAQRQTGIGRALRFGGSTTIIVPLLGLQEEFCAFAEQSDKSKFDCSNRNLSRCSEHTMILNML